MGVCYTKDEYLFRKEESIHKHSPLESAIHAHLPGKSIDSMISHFSKDYSISSPLFQHSVFQKSGPQNGVNEEKENFRSFLSVKTISTYPLLGEGMGREGDPIADYYSVELFHNNAILCVADGCGWGYASRNAAQIATQRFIHFLKDNAKYITNLHQLGMALLRALESAHEGIVTENAKNFTSGTTTILGGVLCQVHTKSRETKWIFAFINLGDCKAFKYSQKTGKFTDLTEENRFQTDGKSDPGGRLGSIPLMDVRNLFLSFCECEKKDILFVVSDGVHDNVDPLSQGLAPVELDSSLSQSWDCLPQEKVEILTNKWREKELARIISQKKKNVTPKRITTKLINYSLKSTLASRNFLEDESNKHKRLPGDYKKFPGKMDHTTCASLLVDEYVSTKEN